MARRKTPSFRQLVLEAGLLSEEQVEACLAELEGSASAEEQNKALAEIAIRKGYMTEDQVRLMQKAAERIARDAEGAVPKRIGEYQILGKLGDGGLGVVYRARQLSMSRTVALKVLHKKWNEDEEFKKRFLLEARLVGRLSHQNLIQVFYVGRDTESECLYFSMEYVDGETVETIVDREGPRSLEQSIDITLQILRAMKYINEHNLVHRDIKPGNIMLDKHGVAKLGDFGFVKSGLDQMLSSAGEVLGTPDYISPEQAMGSDNIDFRSDIYSLGASLYHMVTGAPPFDGSGSTVMRKHIRSELPDPRTYNPDIPEAVCQVIEKMMAKHPDDRYQSFGELFEDLELVKFGHNPRAERLQEGKSSVIRAFKLERTKLSRAEGELEKVREELRTMRTYLVISLGAAAALLVMLAYFLLSRS